MGDEARDEVVMDREAAVVAEKAQEDGVFMVHMEDGQAEAVQGGPCGAPLGSCRARGGGHIVRAMSQHV